MAVLRGVGEIFGVILMRSLDTFIHPIAGWEDATRGINTYIHAGSPIFHAYAPASSCSGKKI